VSCKLSSYYEDVAGCFGQKFARQATEHGDRNPTVRIGSRRHLTNGDNGGRQSLAATLAVVTTSLALGRFVIGTPRGPLLERAGIASVTRGSARSL
jgi:hypothetical protein